MSELVSIVTTLYNYRDYILDLIDSVRKQEYPHWELVIIDDASTDNPQEVLEPYFSKNIRYYRLSQNKGYATAKNEGIISAKGEYIVMIDADDLLTPNSIADRYNALQQCPDKLWCHGDVIDLETGGKISYRGAQKRERLREELAQEMDLSKTYHHRLIHSQSVMVKKDFHRKLGLYDENLKFSADNEMFRRAIRFGHVPVYCKSYVAYYRRHGNQMSRSDYKQKLKDQVKAELIEKVERLFNEGINPTNVRMLR